MPPDPPAAAINRTGWSEAWRLALAGVLGLLGWAMSAPSGSTAITGAVGITLDAGLGALALAIVHWRRSHPMLVVVITSVLAGVSAAATGPAALALFSVAARRRLMPIAVAVLVNFASALAAEFVLFDAASRSWWGTALFAAFIVLITTAIGYAVGSRREVDASRAAVVQSLRERAETAEREQVTRVAAAKATERTRIAREMHDVLAHRISLVAMHASALTYRTDLTPEEQQTAARTIEANAQQALKDLRGVLGVLRSTDSDQWASLTGQVEAPQPVLADVDTLVAEAREAGERIVVDSEIEGEPSATTGRTAYRIIQEGLTNARKHATGAAVTVTLTGAPGDGLCVEVLTPRSRAAANGLPGAGLGLVGLRERVALAGGRLTAGPTPSGGFRLAAELPWGDESEGR